MRPKRRNVCQQCRSRKLGCDGAVPACWQCTLRRISCSGYPQHFVIVSPIRSGIAESDDARKGSSILQGHSKQSGPQAELDKRRLVSSKRGPKSHASSLPPVTKNTTLEDDVHFIVQHYSPVNSGIAAESNPWHNQICGAWVEALPLLLARGHIPHFLASAIRSFAAALSHHCVGSDDLQPKVLELYCESLELVAAALHKAGGVLQIEHCAAIMCLAVTEIVFPTSESSWMKHATAVGQFVERLGPEAFTTGILHKLFVGFRPLLLKSAVFNRRRTFLAGLEWTELPFQGQPISLTQALFNQAVRLPILLERYADLMRPSRAADFVARDQLRTDLESLLQCFQNWEAAAREQSSSPLYWKRLDIEYLCTPSVHPLWFRDLMTATSLTFCWAFEIIVMKHLDLVRRTIEALDTSSHPDREQAEDCSSREMSVALAEMICNSMPYFMRPEMKLWGPASTYFTFTTAVQTFKDNEADCRPQLLRCQQIFDRLNGMRVYFPGIQELLS